MNVAQWMRHEVALASPGMDLGTALGLFRRHEVRVLPVVESGRLVGILTDIDLRDAPPSAATVGVVMRAPAALRPDQSIEEAALLLLGRQALALPVVESGRPVGILTETELLQAFLQLRGKGPLDIAAAALECGGEASPR
jgi:acetoin utilization protein AcuB